MPRITPLKPSEAIRILLHLGFQPAGRFDAAKREQPEFPATISFRDFVLVVSRRRFFVAYINPLFTAKP